MAAPRLRALVAAFNSKVTGYTATLEPSWSSTDRDIPGTRLRHPGKGRKGNKLTIRNSKGVELFCHDSSQTYRTNSEIASRIENNWGRIWEEGTKVKALVCRKCKVRETSKTQGQFTYYFMIGGCLCPTCGKAYE
jgi:hypothetical protein